MATGGAGSTWNEEIFNDDDLFLPGPDNNPLDNIPSRPHVERARATNDVPWPSDHRPGANFTWNAGSLLSQNTDDSCDPYDSVQTDDTANRQPKNSDGSEITDCPICLDTLDRPKALPCLHTFCWDCLSSFITDKAANANRFMPFSNFPCPICRRACAPLDTSKPHKDWANQFPTNNTMLELIRIEQMPHYPVINAQQSQKTLNKTTSKKKAKPTNKYCGNCQTFNKKTIKANLHCDQCSVNLCDTCDSILHLHATDHRRVYVDADDVELQKELSPLPDIGPRNFDQARLVCDRHGQKLDLFCKLHKSAICTTCMMEDHSTCNGVHSFKELSRILKRGRDDLHPRLRDSISATGSMVGIVKQYISSMSADRDSCALHIRDIRSDINNHLDEMERELRDHTAEVSKQEETHLSSVAERCETIHTGLTRSLVRLNAAIQDSDDSRIISSALFCHHQIQQCTNFVKEISAFHSVPRLSVIINPLLAATLDLETFGETTFVREKTELPPPVRKLLPLNCRSAREILRFSVRTRTDRSLCGITSALYMSNNQVILVDFPNKSIKLFSDYGHLVDQLALPSGPWDICRVDDNTFAVTLPFQQTIVFVELDQLTSSLTLHDRRNTKVNMCCYGITYMCGSLVFSCPSQKKVTLYACTDIHARKLQFQPFCKLPLPCFQLTTNTAQREIISTYDSDQGGLLNVSQGGNYSQEVIGSNLATGLRGCDVDQEGNIYMCGRKSKNIVQMSPDSGSRVLLSSAHGLREPSTIAVHDDKFLVAEVASNDVGIYELL